MATTPFTIPNEQDLASDLAFLSAPDKTDIAALVAAFDRTGVITGCDVTQKAGGANMSVDVASGKVAVKGVEIEVVAANVAIGNGHATLPRRDIVVVSNAGVISVVAGAAEADPEKPAIPANSVLLAEVAVKAAEATSITTDEIKSKALNLGKIFGGLETLPVDNTFNFVTNPSFEVDAAGWEANGAGTTIARTVAQFQIGVAALEVSITAGAAFKGTSLSGTLPPSVQNQGWTASAWVKVPSGETFRIALGWTSSGAADTEAVFTGTGAWQRVSVTGIAPAGTTSVDVKLDNSGVDTGSTILVYIDGVQLESGSRTDYCDGSQPNCSWLGTAHASASSRGTPGLLNSVVIEDDTTNLISNPSFEVDVTGWTDVGLNAFSRSSERARIGRYSAKLVENSPGDNYATHSVTGLIPGELYTVSAWVFVDAFTAAATSDRGLWVAGASSGATVLNSGHPRGVWVRHQRSERVHADGSLAIRLYCPHGTVYWDGVQVERGAMSSYCDGSLGDGYSWSGTPHLSTSSRTAGVKVLGRSSGDSFYVGQGRLIAVRPYNPVSIAEVSTSSNTFGDVDETNMAVTFMFPPSGKVLIRLTAVGYGGGSLNWGLREGTVEVPGSGGRISSLGSGHRHSHAMVLHGTPGSVVTYKWAHRNEDNSTAVYTTCGGARGQAVMEVWEAP